MIQTHDSCVGIEYFGTKILNHYATQPLKFIQTNKLTIFSHLQPLKMRKHSQESLQTKMIRKRIQFNKSNYYQMHIMNRHGVYDILMSTHA